MVVQSPPSPTGGCSLAWRLKTVSLHLLWSLVVLTKGPVPGLASCSSFPTPWPGMGSAGIAAGFSDTSCPLMCSSVRAGVFGDRFFQDTRRCQVFPLTSTPGLWALYWEGLLITLHGIPVAVGSYLTYSLSPPLLPDTNLQGQDCAPRPRVPFPEARG